MEIWKWFFKIKQRTWNFRNRTSTNQLRKIRIGKSVSTIPNRKFNFRIGAQEYELEFGSGFQNTQVRILNSGLGFLDFRSRIVNPRIEMFEICFWCLIPDFVFSTVRVRLLNFRFGEFGNTLSTCLCPSCFFEFRFRVLQCRVGIVDHHVHDFKFCLSVSNIDVGLWFSVFGFSKIALEFFVFRIWFPKRRFPFFIFLGAS